MELSSEKILEEQQKKKGAEIRERLKRILRSYTGKLRLSGTYGHQLRREILEYSSSSGKTLDECAADLDLSIGQLDRLYHQQYILGTSDVKPFRSPPEAPTFKPIVETDETTKILKALGVGKKINKPEINIDAFEKTPFRIRFNGAEVEFLGLGIALHLIEELKK